MKVETNPVIAPEAEARIHAAYRAARFWDRFAARYAQTPISDEVTYQEKLRITRALLRPDATLFEFGCGTGSTALLHAPHVAEILATDISARMIDIATAKAAAAGAANVTFARQALDEVARSGRRFDVVLALNVLHLMKAWRAAIAQVHDLLQPGGVFVSSTGCLGDWAQWARFLAPITGLSGALPQVQVFSTRDLLDAHEGVGFRIERCWQPPGRAKAVFVVARKAG